MPRTCLLAAMLALPVASASAQVCPPHTEPGHIVRYYEVSGATEEELERSLNGRAPTGPNGMPAYGLTEWCVGWSYVPWKRSDRCELAQVSTVLRTTVTLPRWIDSETAPASLAEWWSGFSRAIEAHEDGHVENARAAEAAIAEALSTLEPPETCGAAVRAADRVALDLYWIYYSRDREYDRDTRYGRDQLDAALARQ